MMINDTTVKLKNTFMLQKSIALNVDIQHTLVKQHHATGIIGTNSRKATHACLEVKAPK